MKVAQITGVERGGVTEVADPVIKEDFVVVEQQRVGGPLPICASSLVAAEHANIHIFDEERFSGEA